MAPPLSITIRNLRAQNGGAEILVTVVIGNGEQSETRTMLLTTEQYCALNPRKGAISEEQFEALEQASRRCMALRCGERLLAYGANTAKLLSQKIMRHGFSREEAVYAAAHLQNAGLIDESSDLRREVDKCLRKLWGPGRIRTHLWSRGFDRAAMEELPAILEETDFSVSCAALWRKHYGGLSADPAETRRTVAALYRYGYSPEDIRHARRLLQERE